MNFLKHLPFRLVFMREDMPKHQAQYMVLARRYRPQLFNEVLGQDSVIQTLKNGLHLNRLASAYLFSGTRGTGKTTLARIFAKALLCHERLADGEPCNTCKSCQEIMNGSSLDVMEIDGASHRGIDDIRLITESAGYAPAGGSYKIYIIDEVHMLTKEAFNALLKTLEEPPIQVKFFFATTEPHKIPETIISRCQRFHLRRIPLELIAKKLERIAKEAGAEVEDTALFHLARYAEGGLRDAESMLDLLLAYSNMINMQTIELALGLLPKKWLFEFDTAYQAQQYGKVFELTHTLFDQGKDVSFFLKDIIHHFRHILLCKLSCLEELRHEDNLYIEEVKAVSAAFTQEECLAILEVLTTAELGMKASISQQIFLEATLLKVMRLRSLIPLDRIAMRLTQLEQSIKKPPEPKASVAQQHEEALSPKREILQTLKEAVPKVDAGPIKASKSHFDTVMQFAAVELQGSLEKKQSK